MSREEAKKILDAVISKGLYSAIIFYVSPLTKNIEERHIYADSNFECTEWLNYRKLECEKYNVQALVSYTNGRICDQIGDISKYFK